MTKSIKISNCHECPHLDHDGALRRGGAFHVCGKVLLTESEAEAQDGVLRRRLNPGAPPCVNRANVRRFDGTIPSWCPL